MLTIGTRIKRMESISADFFNKVTQNLSVFICLISQIRVPIQNSISIQSNQLSVKKLFLCTFKRTVYIVNITIMYFQFISTMKL